MLWRLFQRRAGDGASGTPSAEKGAKVSSDAAPSEQIFLDMATFQELADLLDSWCSTVSEDSEETQHI